MDPHGAPWSAVVPMKPPWTPNTTGCRSRGKGDGERPPGNRGAALRAARYARRARANYHRKRSQARQKAPEGGPEPPLYVPSVLVGNDVRTRMFDVSKFWPPSCSHFLSAHYYKLRVQKSFRNRWPGRGESLVSAVAPGTAGMRLMVPSALSYRPITH